ncbi:hypothetical protein C0992_005180, partial [Termitomyces sp. T32_za158]
SSVENSGIRHSLSQASSASSESQLSDQNLKEIQSSITLPCSTASKRKGNDDAREQLNTKRLRRNGARKKEIGTNLLSRMSLSQDKGIRRNKERPSISPEDNETNSWEQTEIPDLTLNTTQMNRALRNEKSKKATYRGSKKRSLLGRMKIPVASRTESCCVSTSETQVRSNNTLPCPELHRSISPCRNGTSSSEESQEILIASTAPSIMLEYLKRIEGVSVIVRSSLDTAIQLEKSRIMANGPSRQVSMEKHWVSPGRTEEVNGQTITSTLSGSSRQNPRICMAALSNSTKQFGH